MARRATLFSSVSFVCHLRTPLQSPFQQFQLCYHYPARVCAGGVKRLLLSVRLCVCASVRLSVCPWQNSTVGISEGLNNFYTWQKHIASVDFSMCVLDKLNSPICRRTWLESLWYRRHFLPCVASYPGFCLQDCYMCNNDSWLALGMCSTHF